MDMVFRFSFRYSVPELLDWNIRETFPYDCTYIEPIFGAQGVRGFNKAILRWNCAPSSEY